MSSTSPLALWADPPHSPLHIHHRGRAPYCVVALKDQRVVDLTSTDDEIQLQRQLPSSLSLSKRGRAQMLYRPMRRWSGKLKSISDGWLMAARRLDMSATVQV